MTEPAVAEATPEHPAAEPAAAEDHIEVEVVQAAEAKAPAVPEQPSALQRAAEELLATPGAPGRDEFLVLATTARILSLSQGAPKAVRDNPWLAFHLALIGRDLGISPSAAIAQIDVIGEGDDAQLSLSPELLNAQIKRLGIGSIVPAASSPTACTAVALLPGGRVDARCARGWPEHADGCRCTFDLILGEHEFTWQDAQQAGLVDSACVAPTEHTGACLQGGSGTRGKRCHQGYRTYPKRMMWWRAAGYASADYFPEASVGLYSPEELGAVVNPETGRPYDPATVELPEGYEPPEKPRNPGDDFLAEADADPDNPDAELVRERDDLRARLNAITAAGEQPRAALKELWEKEDDDGNRRWPPFPRLRRRHLIGVRAMVKSIEDRIKKTEWGDETKTAWADASVSGAGFGKGAAEEPQEDGGGADGEQPREVAGGPEGAQEPAEPGVDEEAAALERRRARAAQIAAEAGVEPAVAHAQEVAERVKAMEMTDVVLGLAGFSEEPKGNPQAQRKRLAELIYMAEVAAEAEELTEPADEA